MVTSSPYFLRAVNLPPFNISEYTLARRYRSHLQSLFNTPRVFTAAVWRRHKVDTPNILGRAR